MGWNLVHTEQRLENECRAFENMWGATRISRFVAEAVPSDQLLDFIDAYRQLIRTNTWSFTRLDDMSHEQFLREWGDTHVAYIRTAARFLNLLLRRDAEGCGFSDVHAAAILSETNRGRVGKRSPIGLDARLDRDGGAHHRGLRHALCHRRSGNAYIPIYY